jgi:hypothetical protein
MDDAESLIDVVLYGPSGGIYEMGATVDSCDT